MTTSSWTRERLLDRYRLPPERVQVARPGADLVDEAPGTPGGGRLLCVAAVVPHKGHDLLLEALRGIAQPPWICTFVGALDRDPTFVDSLRRQAAGSGILDRIRFLGPRVGEELLREYRAADILVFPTRIEAYGMVVTEALAVGLPVIATAVGGVPEALGCTADGSPGVLVPPDDAGRLGEALGAWLQQRGSPGPIAAGGPPPKDDVGRLGRHGATPGRGAGLRRRWRGPGGCAVRPRCESAGTPVRTATQRAWAGARPLGGAAILAVLVWRLGTGPFLDGLRQLSAWSLLAATSITALTTVCSAWRWQTVARGLGVGLPLGTAIAAYYRSQFLNCVLPGGVVGDVHRGVRHGLDAGDVEPRAARRGVGADGRTGCVRHARPRGAARPGLASAPRHGMGRGGCWSSARSAWLSCCGLSPAAAPSRWARVVRAGRADIRDGLLDRRALPVVLLTSVVVAAGHVSIFLVAAWTTGSAASPARLWPLAMLVLLAMVVPLNVGGWGPREGVAAWAFAARWARRPSGRRRRHRLRCDGTRRDAARSGRASRRPDRRNLTPRRSDTNTDVSEAADLPVR